MLATAVYAVASLLGGGTAQANAAVQQKPNITSSTTFLSTALRPTPPRNLGHTHQPWTKRVCDPPYVAGDPDLGPKFLPRTGWLGMILRGYVPLGGLSPQHFLSRYWDYTLHRYRYPDNSGFARSGNYPNGRLLIKRTFLRVGMKVDRFGSDEGAYLSPLGVLFTQRALPPSNLDTDAQDPTHLCGYHAFQVTKAFRVDSGPAAPAFEQPGGATQYHLLSAYVPGAPQTNEELPVSWLLQNGYLERIEPAGDHKILPRDAYKDAEEKGDEAEMGRHGKGDR
jgi:hypothetical protein